MRYILVSYPESLEIAGKNWFNECIVANVGSQEGPTFFVPEEYYDELIINSFENQSISKENDISSKIVKFILATNYYYSIIDEVKGTEFFKHKLKQLINQVEKELDSLQRNDKIKGFYSIANEKLYLNNLDLHCMFFEKLSQTSSGVIEQFMIEFLRKYSIKNGN